MYGGAKWGGRLRSTERMVIVFLTSRTLMTFALCICLMYLPICLYDVRFASSCEWPAGRAGCMWWE